MCSKKGGGKEESAYTATDPGILIAFVCGQRIRDPVKDIRLDNIGDIALAGSVMHERPTCPA